MHEIKFIREAQSAEFLFIIIINVDATTKQSEMFSSWPLGIQ